MIVGFCGYAGSGKTTAARHLEEAHGWARLPFSAPLKAMLEALGVPYECLYGEGKNDELDLLGGKSARWAMQTLGTEWGREMVDEDLWARAWAQAAEAHYRNLVCDDVRFPNEAATIRRLGGIVVRIDREGCEPSEHASERLRFDCSFVIRNNHDIEELCRRVDRLVFGEGV